MIRNMLRTTGPSLNFVLCTKSLNDIYQKIKKSQHGFTRDKSCVTPVISESLSRIINHCITTGKFPAKWKVANVTPIYH